MTLRLLAVHAHPDDESSKGAATYAYYRSLGARVMVVSCTGGELGDVQNEGLAEMAMAERDIAGLRRHEMAAAQRVMRIEHRWLGYRDSGMAPEEGQTVPPLSFAAIPLEISGVPLVKVLREFRPHVVVSYDENGGYPHPDHIRAHEIAVWAMDAAADPSRNPEWGGAWQVAKHYYDRIMNPKRFAAVYEHLVGVDPQHPLIAVFEEMRTWMGERVMPNVTTQVPVADFFATGNEALRAHSSQVPPDSPFFFWPTDIQRAAWPWEDFELVASRVETTLPESDLFAGITDEDNT